MRDDYKIQQATSELSTQVEVSVFNALQAMAKHTQLTVAEITNTALKRFIASHKDFLPSHFVSELSSTNAATNAAVNAAKDQRSKNA